MNRGPAGAALGSIGLAAFGGTVYWLAPRLSAWATLALATLAWATCSALAWMARKKI